MHSNKSDLLANDENLGEREFLNIFFHHLEILGQIFEKIMKLNSTHLSIIDICPKAIIIYRANIEQLE